MTSRRNYSIEEIRQQFPALRSAGSPIYLDGPAGTQVPDQVIARMVEALTTYRANVHGNFASSLRATKIVEESRHAVADLVNARSEREIIFGANMTSLTFQMTRTLGPRFSPGDELLLTGMQHDGNTTPWLMMAAERGMTVRRVEFDPTTYQLNRDELSSAISSKTAMVAINYSSNVLGTINDVQEICRLARNAGALTYVDAVQYAPHGPVNVQALDCDFLVASMYKIFGPHIGVLFGRAEVLQDLRPHKLRAASDDIPDRFETGTKSLEGIAGTMGAVEYLEWVGAEFGVTSPAALPGLRPRTVTLYEAFAAMTDYEQPLVTRLIQGLHALPGVVVHGITDLALLHDRVPTVSFSQSGLDREALAIALSNRGIYCWNGDVYAPDVIDRLGLTLEGGVIRMGITHTNTLSEVETTLATLGELL